MSQVCEICGKRPTTGKQLSHSHIRTNRWFRPNLTVKKIVNPKSGESKKTKLCMQCLRSMAKKYIQTKFPKTA